MSAPFSTKYLTISVCVMKQALRTGVDPVSDNALISEPNRISTLTTGRLPETAAHHKGVTQCTDLSSGTSYKPRCSRKKNYFFSFSMIVFTDNVFTDHSITNGYQVFSDHGIATLACDEKWSRSVTCPFTQFMTYIAWQTTISTREIIICFLKINFLDFFFFENDKTTR